MDSNVTLSENSSVIPSAMLIALLIKLNVLLSKRSPSIIVITVNIYWYECIAITAQCILQSWRLNPHFIKDTTDFKKDHCFMFQLNCQFNYRTPCIRRYILILEISKCGGKASLKHQNRYYCYTNKKSKAQKSLVTDLRSHSKLVKELNSVPKSDSRMHALPHFQSMRPVCLSFFLLSKETHKGWDGILFIFTSPALKHKRSTQGMFVERKNLNLQVILSHLLFFYWMENEKRI